MSLEYSVTCWSIAHSVRRESTHAEAVMYPLDGPKRRDPDLTLGTCPVGPRQAQNSRY